MRTLADAFGNMIENIKSQAETIRTIAGGDLTVSVEARSDNDVINQALASMVALNNEAFAKIADTANQVSVGSRQIADSAQYLSQGAVEQTSAVEKLSAIIREMDEKTRENADMAQKAAALAETIKGSAQKGAGQMQNMTQAVKEINVSNQSILKIIKVINEIAFQTNLLSLNASVEAARAGAHGRGFAVVADEVRNLAAKSAEAAKETGALLADSTQKVELGVRIAGETAGSLSEIMAGINENGSLVTQIVSTSQKQRNAITKVNASISQVIQVVQRNSATAEESAAASEEMSAQSEALHRLTTQFKLAEYDGEGIAAL
jgi:methyl-accepting chemotaxis protein